MAVTKILRVQGRFVQNGPYNSRFEELREEARHKRVIYNSCNVGKKSVPLLLSRELTSFYGDPIPLSSGRTALFVT